MRTSAHVLCQNLTKYCKLCQWNGQLRKNKIFKRRMETSNSQLSQLNQNQSNETPERGTFITTLAFAAKGRQVNIDQISWNRMYSKWVHQPQMFKKTSHGLFWNFLKCWMFRIYRRKLPSFIHFYGRKNRMKMKICQSFFVCLYPNRFDAYV